MNDNLQGSLHGYAPRKYGVDVGLRVEKPPLKMVSSTCDLEDSKQNPLAQLHNICIT